MRLVKWSLHPYFNDLHDAMRQRRSKEVLEKTINDLVDYTHFHFSTEETYFEKFSYPDAKQHQKEHAYFVTRILKFKQDFDNKKSLLSIDIMEFLRDWLIKHIQRTDKKYVPFFKTNGLQ